MYIKRYLESAVDNITRTFKVLYLTGPRQVGKTTMLKHLASRHNMKYVSFDDFTVRRLALADPALFLAQYPSPLFIDEAQYVPTLFSALKHKVDQSDIQGQYWLSGSQQFASQRNVQESLAGRVGILELLGFSLAEQKGIPLQMEAWRPDISVKTSKNNASSQSENIFDAMFRGFFPRLWQENPPTTNDFYNSYLQTYIDRDLRDLFGVTKILEFHRFIQLCADRTGKQLNYSDLARDAGISVQAARDWMSILISTRQVYLLQPYHVNFTKRVIKSPKLYFLDTGFAAHLLGVQNAENLKTGLMAGHFFETFVMSEIIKSYLFRGKNPPLYYFRDKDGHEVDLLIEQNKKIYPVEIKMKVTITSEDNKNITYIRKRFPTQSQAGAIICLTSERRPFDEFTHVIPISDIC